MKKILYRIKFRLLIIFFISTFIFASSISSHAKKPNITKKSGHLVLDETWSGRIHVIGDVIVPKGVTLTIRPSTTITFAENKSDFDMDITIGAIAQKEKCNIIVRGNLKAVGGRSDKITFGGGKSYDEKNYYWGGIVFEGESDSSLKYCQIENAVFGITMLKEKSLNISNSTIQKCSIGVYSANTGSGKFISSIIRKCGTGVECTSESAPKIISNVISENEWGISYGNSSTPIVNDNTIIKNKYGIICYGDKVATFEGNNINENYVGIKFKASSKPFLKKNEINGNDIGIQFEGGALPEMIKNTLTKNKMNIQK